jgi:hypothetical protein
MATARKPKYFIYQTSYFRHQTSALRPQTSFNVPASELVGFIRPIEFWGT